MALAQPLSRSLLYGEGLRNSLGRSTCCLLVHGLNAVPEDFDSLAVRLTGAGLHCQALRLPGHTGHIRALAATTWTEWLLAVVRATKAALDEYQGVILIGHSLGAALAVAGHEAGVAGVVALCPPLQLRPFEILALRFMRYVLPVVPGWLHDVPLWHWQVLHQIRHACSWIPLRPVVSLIQALPALCWELPQVSSLP
jgi:carboxylesterase